MTKLSEHLTHSLTRTFGILLVAWFCSGASCADIGDGSKISENCVVDEECDTAQICFRGECATSCVRDEDCDFGVCRSELRSEEDDVVDVCVADEVNSNNIDAECRFDADCSDVFPGVDARCGIDGTCFFPAFSLLIRDTTAVDASMPAVDGGFGADIAAVYIEDPDTHEPLAWADTLTLMPANDVVPVNAPDGEPRALSEDGMCLDAAYELAATPLGGAGGFLLVRFLDSASGEVVATPLSSQNIVIVEWGANCPDGEMGEPDSFDIFSCAATSHQSTNLDRDCGELLARSTSGGRLVFEGSQK